jgi:hypothetical protein
MVGGSWLLNETRSSISGMLRTPLTVMNCGRDTGPWPSDG